MLMRKTSRKKKRRVRESGQAAVFLVLAMGLFLIGSMGFVVDGANLWFHRQSAQTAADAACTAGAMNMLSVAAGAKPPSENWIGTSFLCSGSSDNGKNKVPNSGFAPCQYAAFNGYTSSGLQSNQAGNDVSVIFPGSFSIPLCSNGSILCNAEDLVATPYIQVNVTDRVQTTFIGMLNGGHTMDVGAQAICGLSNVLSAVPILVLNPNAAGGSASNTFSTDNRFVLTVINGPQKSVQVNSTTSDLDLDTGTINLTRANNGNVGDFAVAKREAKPSNFGTLGNWVDAAGMISDPFAMVDAPAQPSFAPSPTPPITGCSGLPAGVSCDHYQPGRYSASIPCPASASGFAAICVGKGINGGSGLAVFDPGIYYLDGDFVADANSCLRPGNSAQGIGGTLFYFHGGHTLNVTANSGGLRQPGGGGGGGGEGGGGEGGGGGGGSTIFDCQDPGYAVPSSTIQCPSGSYSNLPPGVASLTGNVLLGPCSGTYGDPQSTGARGMLFFQDREAAAVQPAWNASSSFGLIGNLYFHYCNSSSDTGSGANCNTNAFSDTLSLGSGSASYIVGDIVADQLALSGSSNITVMLNPNAQYYVLKASLLQ